MRKVGGLMPPRFCMRMIEVNDHKLQEVRVVLTMPSLLVLEVARLMVRPQKSRQNRP